MKHALKCLATLIIVFLSLAPRYDNSKTEMGAIFPSEKNLSVGEELTYIVTYSFMKLGEVKIKIRDKKEVNGKTYYSTIAYIDSYSGIPFVNVHQTYESNVSTGYYSYFFRGVKKEEEPYTYTDYYFDYEKNNVRVKKGRFSPPKVWTDSIGNISKFYQDGLSVFYYARMNCGQDTVVDVPCFVAEKKVTTKINFYKEITDASIEAVDYDIECVRIDGEMDFISIFGLTGHFEGWFTNDEASIPVVAKMKVIIGNIKLELMNWKREGWQPPKYKG
jgi:hypothetical protein